MILPGAKVLGGMAAIWLLLNDTVTHSPNGKLNDPGEIDVIKLLFSSTYIYFAEGKLKAHEGIVVILL